MFISSIHPFCQCVCLFAILVLLLVIYLAFTCFVLVYVCLLYQYFYLFSIQHLPVLFVCMSVWQIGTIIWPTFCEMLHADIWRPAALTTKYKFQQKNTKHVQMTCRCGSGQYFKCGQLTYTTIECGKRSIIEMIRK